jgi:hypothetical protein
MRSLRRAFQAARASAGRPRAASTQLREQLRLRRVVREHLRVPLNAEAEACGRVPDGLDGAVGRSGGDAQARAERVDRLVVERVDLESVAAGEPAEQRVALDVRAEPRVTRMAVSGRIEVGASAEDEPVDPAQQ